MEVEGRAPKDEQQMRNTLQTKQQSIWRFCDHCCAFTVQSFTAKGVHVTPTDNPQTESHTT